MIRRARYLSILPLTLLATNDARAKDVEAFSAYAQAKPVSVVAAPAASRGFVASVDEKRGTPTFFWATRNGKPLPQSLAGAGPERIARHHLTQHADLYGLAPQALQTARRVHTHDTGGGIIVIFRQSIDGIDVLHSDMKVLMDRRGNLVALGGALHPAAIAGTAKKWGAFSLAPNAAVSRALKDLYGAEVSPASLRPQKEKKAGYDLFTLDKSFKVNGVEHAFAEPARAKKVYYPMPNTLVPAYYLEVQVASPGSDSIDVYAYMIAANDGRLLLRTNLTEYEAFQYRVWADDVFPYTPKDGPRADFTPHPTGIPDGSIPPFTAPTLITVEGFNTNPQGVPDPWLPAGATETKGNNIDAYTDHTDCAPVANTTCTAAVSAANDGFTAGVDIRADVTAPGVFDRTFDTSLAPLSSQDQSKAAVTQLFYTTNWLHDYWYDSGFTEPAGNAQESNYGRGGEEGDVLRAQAQDKAIGIMPNNVGAQRNNANMSTPADGSSPRMQMFLWSNDEGKLDVGAPINATYPTGTASFGPPNFDFGGDLILANDGVLEPPAAPGGAAGTLSDACSPLPAAVSGKIVLADRGYCSFFIKATNVRDAGGIGMILANNQGTAPVGMGGSNDQTLAPSLSISLANGNALKAALANGPVTIAKMKRSSGVEHDGTIDNSIVGHEWGHYLHNRLVVIGGTNQGRGMGEGWADFVAIHMGSHEGENFATGTFAAAQYSTVSFNDEGYYGIRRLPYTRDMTKNPLTFKHIDDSQMLPSIAMNSGGGNNAQVHNSGEVWCSMMWDSYTSMILSNKRSFDATKRKMADYVVGGMMMAPVSPTYTEQRDGILAYAAASDKEDMLLIAEQFARRGAGTCAVSPARTSTNHNGVVESYEVKGNHRILSVGVDDSVTSCDSDGILDGGETGKVTIELVNNGPATLTDTVVTVLTSNPGVIFPNGNTVTIASMPGFEKVTRTIDIALAPGQYQGDRLDLEVTAENAGGCVTKAQFLANDRQDVDDLASISTTDTVDSRKSTWTPTGTGAEEIWARTQEANGNWEWLGVDASIQTDTRLETADIEVSSTGNFVLSFEHRYEFEFSPAVANGPNVAWDGAVIEVTSDGGQTWQDVSTYLAPGYNGTIHTEAGATAPNPLEGKAAFVNKNPSHPATDAVTLNFKNAFAGKTVRFRFRIGTDGAVGGPGWEIDNIAVLWSDNKPFSAVVDDTGECNGVPVADAGPDKTAMSGTLVQLDGSASSDPDGDPLSFNWTKSAGPEVSLFAAATATPVFLAPAVQTPTVMTFALSVTDGKGSGGDTVDVLVVPDPNAGGEGGMGGAGGAGGGGVGGAGGMGGAGGAAGMGGAGGAAGMGGAGGAAGMGGAGGAAGMGGAAGGGAGGAGAGATGGTGGAAEGGADGGEIRPEGGCECTAAGSESAPVRPGLLGSLGLVLGLMLRRNRRAAKN